jgi:nucleotide-binding universal stress UspA family protein
MDAQRGRRQSEAMTILVAFDPQTFDRAPVRFAAAAARFADVPLVIASIRTDVAPAPSARVDLVGEELGRLRADLTREHGNDVRTRVGRVLPPAGVARALQHVIVEEHASLVVVGASNRGVIGRVVPGTTAQQVMDGCTCPVVVVPHGYEPPNQLTTVGVAFVPTPEGRRALQQAAAIARMTGARLRVLTAMKPSLGADASAGPARDAAERHRAELDDTVAEAIAEHAGGLQIESDVFVDDPADALVRVAPHLDLLVMGSRGYGPRLAVLLGGVSRRVTTTAQCPVLVVPRSSSSALALFDDPATATLWQTYSDETAARQAAEALRAAGIPGLNVRLLAGDQVHDVRREVVGAFAGAVGPSARVGTYGDVGRVRRQGAGSFAGDPDRQRQGSFGDADRDVIVSYEDDHVRSRVTGRGALTRLLRSASLPQRGTDRVIDALDAGRSVVLVELHAVDATETRAHLEEGRRAA